MKAILKLFLLLVLFLVSPISFAQSDPCSDLIKIFHTCIEDDVLVCTNTDHRCTAQWAQSCIMSYEEYEAKLMACRRQNPPQMTGALPELSSGRAESYFETKGNGVSWFYGGVEEYIPGFWDAVGTVLSDIQSEPNSLFSPKRISALQEEDMHKNLSNVKQSLEKEITEEKVKNKVFQSDFEQLQKDQKALTDPLDQALAKVEENMDLKFAQFLENEKAELGKLNIPEETQSSRTAEDILKTGLPETIEKVQKEKTDFEKELQLLFDDKNYIELNQKIYETQLELSTLNAISPLPHALEIYAQAKREVISQYIDEQGLIHFTSDSHRFPQPKLYSDPNSLTGIELRYHMGRGLIAWETQKDEVRNAKIAIALSYLIGADSAAAQDAEDAAQALLDSGKTLLDMVLGFTPSVGEIYDIGNLIGGILTGKDLLGHPMEGWDYLLASVGAAIPFLSMGHLKIIKEGLKERNIFIHNPLPKIGESLSRVISEKDFFKYFKRGEKSAEKGALFKEGGRPFITATEDLADVTTHEGMIKRLGFDGDFKEYKDLQDGNLYELKITPQNSEALEKLNLQTPIKNEHPNFIGKGKTSGGAREWDMKNLDYAMNPKTNEWHLFPEGTKELPTEKIDFNNSLGTIEVKRMIPK